MQAGFVLLHSLLGFLLTLTSLLLFLCSSTSSAFIPIYGLSGNVQGRQVSVVRTRNHLVDAVLRAPLSPDERMCLRIYKLP